jgi:EmrB/QacA subfamily drug resistance transporter
MRQARTTGKHAFGAGLEGRRCRIEQRVRYGSRQGKLALLASILGSGMAFLDGTAVNVALPVMGDELGAGFSGLQWIINGYLLSLGALVLLGGALGDRYGRRRVFVTGVIAFGVASTLCGAAPSTITLIVARVVQGAAAALLIPSSLSMLQAGFDPEDRGRAIGVWSGFSGITTLIGPLLGGWLVDAVSWRLVFLINPVFALVTAFVALRSVPESRNDEVRNAALDVTGAALIVVALAGIVFALIEGPERGWVATPVIIAAATGLLAILAFMAWERRAQNPMLPLHIFRSLQFSGVNSATTVVYFVLSGAFFLLTLQLQRVLDYSAFEAGAAMAPITILLLFLSPPAGRIADRIGPRLPMTIGPIIAGAGLALLARAQPGTSYMSGPLPGIIVFGIGLGFTVAPLTAAALAALPDHLAGLASGVNNAVTRIAGLLAVPLLPLAAGMSGIDRVNADTFAAGFSTAMWISAGFIAVGGLIAWLTVRGRP